MEHGTLLVTRRDPGMETMEANETRMKVNGSIHPKTDTREVVLKL
jgi:hypothetical protein